MRTSPEARIQFGDGCPQYLHEMTDAATQEAEKIVAMPDEHNMNVSMDLGFEQRFNGETCVRRWLQCPGQ